MKPNKIIVTGGFGFLGQHVVRQLKEQFSHATILPFSRRNGLDLLDYDKSLRLLQSEKPDVLIHCAANVGGLSYNRLYPVQVFEENTLIGLNVVKVCAEAGITIFINVMPNCTYPGHLEEYEESRWWDGPIHESVLTYGLPRKMLWGASFSHCQNNSRFKPVHLILPNLFGPGDHFDPVRSHALGALIAKIAEAKKKNLKTVAIWGTGKPVREWLFVSDAVRAIIKSMENIHLFEPNEIMNIGEKKGISIIDLAELIKNIIDWNGEFVLQLGKPDGATQKIIIADKMSRKLGFKLDSRFRENIKKTIQWYLEKETQ